MDDIIGGRVLKNVRDEKKVVVDLDLDECSCIGGDTNDILAVVGIITDNYTKKVPELLSMTSQLINPQLVPAFRRLKRSLGYEPLVVFYTSKYKIVDWFVELLHPSEEVAQEIIEGLRHVIKDRDNLVFSMADISQSFLYLNKEVQKLLGSNTELSNKMKNELNRIGLITWTISNLLGLSYAGSVFVTTRYKDLNYIARELDIPPDQFFLFDDKAKWHAKALEKTPEEVQMIDVHPFTFESMKREDALRLQNTLTRDFPLDEPKLASHLPGYPDLLTYKYGPKPTPGFQSVDRDPESGALRWNFHDVHTRSMHPKRAFPMEDIVIQQLKKRQMA